jgi:hypothetical protein
LIQHLLHSEINKQRWDDCIDHSINSLPNAASWWLDIVSPGWEALVQDDYAAVMPLTRKRKMGIDFLIQPYFTQQLGLFSTHLINDQLTDQFLNAIPARYHYIDIQLNAMNHPVNSDFTFKTRRNYTLDLTPSYIQLSTNYHRNCRRNVQKAIHAGFTVKPGPGPSVFTRFVHRNLSKKLTDAGRHLYHVLQQITKKSLENGTGEILSIYNNPGEIIASGWFVVSAGRCMFEVCASTAEGTQNQAMYLLVDHMLKEKSGSGVIFDFTGSNLPGVAYFNAGFGASESIYLSAKRNLLPWPLKLIKR